MLAPRSWPGVCSRELTLYARPSRGRSHFKVVVVSDAFEDKRLIARHRLINSVLQDESGTLPFHSLSIAGAKTPAEWGVNANVPESPKCMGGDGSGLKR